MVRPALLWLATFAVMAPPALGSTPIKLPASPVATTEPEVTGLVLDARGLHYQPCMSPHLYDDSAHNLLGGLSFDPEKVTSDGFAHWVRSVEPQEVVKRAGKHPLFLKPLRVEGGDRLVFSTEDGAELLAADAKSKFLERMRVLIIY